MSVVSPMCVGERALVFRLNDHGQGPELLRQVGILQSVCDTSGGTVSTVLLANIKFAWFVALHFFKVFHFGVRNYSIQLLE